MYTKSIIQQKIEMINVKNDFKSSIQNIMDNYNIEDNVFVYTRTGILEAVEGYFVIESEFTDLSKAISACNINEMGIRVINNNQFQVGKIYKYITECNTDKPVFDLKRLKNVR
jgi:cell division GTPase FtsZ